MPENLSSYTLNLSTSSLQSSIKTCKYQVETHLFRISIWDRLTELPYSKITSNFVDRQLAKMDGDHE